MKKIFLILMGGLFFVFISCSIYEDETFSLSDSDANINNSFKNDSTVTIDTLDLVVIESINKDFDETWVDTNDNWLNTNVYEDILDPNVVLLDTIETVNITSGDLNNKYLLQSSNKQSGYAIFDMSSQTDELQLDIFLNSFFALTVWKTDGTLLEIEEHSIPLETINFEENVIMEHFVYKMQNEKYVVRFDPAESVTSGNFQALILQNWNSE